MLRWIPQFVRNGKNGFWLGAVVIVVGIGAAIVYFFGGVVATAVAVFLTILAAAFGIWIGGSIAPPVQSDPWFKTYQPSVVGIIGPTVALFAALIAWTAVQGQIGTARENFRADQTPDIWAPN